jgi:DNA-binding CsgD family transcriptional regulator
MMQSPIHETCLAPRQRRPLSPRQTEIVNLIASGLTSAQIAGKLYLSVKTVKNHVTSIYKYFDAYSRTAAIVKAIQQGVIDADEITVCEKVAL